MQQRRTSHGTTMKSGFPMKGFNLFELLISIMLISILAAITISSQKFLLNSATEKNFQDQLLSAINLARQEALLRNTNLIFCKSKDHLSCNGDWLDGQILFVKQSDDEKILPDQKILFEFSSHLHSGKLYWRSFPLNKNYWEVSSQLSMNGTFWYCRDEGNEPSWAIVINQRGRARVVSPNKNGKIIISNHTLQCV